MPKQTDTLQDRLSRFRQINIRVTGRKSGRPISNTVWFVMDGTDLCLLPVRGSDTQWYKNLLHNSAMWIEAKGAEAEFNGSVITDAKQVSSVVQKFRAKYGAGEIEKYYSKLDVAVLAHFRKSE